MIKKWKFSGLFIPFVLFLLACGSVVGPGGLIVGKTTTYEVGSIADSRFDTGYTLDGPAMIATRSKLLEPSNFGNNGTAAFNINITDTAATLDSGVTEALLSNFDVFFIGNLDDNNFNKFSTTELDALDSWVTNNGGVLIVTCDDIDHDAVCAFFDNPVSGSATPPTEPEPASTGHLIFAGSFGTVTSLSMDGSGTKGVFSDTPTDATVLGEDKVLHPTVLERQLDNGGVIFISDLDMITELGGITAGTGMLNENDFFLGNLFEYALDVL